jgi:chaperone modulatory protein CbpM
MNGERDPLTISLRVDELSRSCRCSVELIVTLVHEGAIPVQGERPEDWRFGGDELARARRAVRLARELDINPPGIALALELLEEIERLRTALAMPRGTDRD